MATVSRRSIVTSLGMLPFGLAVTAGLAAATGFDDQQPHMRAALEALRGARRHLDLAAPDKGGHRVKAIEHVNMAITETEAGISYDATH